MRGLVSCIRRVHKSWALMQEMCKRVRVLKIGWCGLVLFRCFYLACTSLRPHIAGTRIVLQSTMHHLHTWEFFHLLFNWPITSTSPVMALFDEGPREAASMLRWTSRRSTSDANRGQRPRDLERFIKSRFWNTTTLSLAVRY
jgi:hypothetical protein